MRLEKGWPTVTTPFTPVKPPFSNAVALTQADAGLRSRCALDYFASAFSRTSQTTASSGKRVIFGRPARCLSPISHGLRHVTRAEHRPTHAAAHLCDSATDGLRWRRLMGLGGMGKGNCAQKGNEGFGFVRGVWV